MSEKRFLRFRDLKARGIVGNWTTLLRWIRDRGFPVGVMLGANTRVWPEDEINAWLANLPAADKEGGKP